MEISGRGKLEGFKTLEFCDLEFVLREHQEKLPVGEKEFIFIADMSGVLVDFFKYNGLNMLLYDFYRDVAAHIMGKTKTQEEVREELRRKLVYALQHSGIVINAGGMIPAFRDYQPKDLDLDKCFDPQFFLNDKNYMKIVKDEENKSLQGDKNNFTLSEKFFCIFLMDFSDADYAEDDLV